MKKSKLMVIICAFILLGGMSSLDMSQAAEPYKLGIALAVTGTGALYCKDGVDAIKLAVDEINAQGGFLKKHPLVHYKMCPNEE